MRIKERWRAFRNWTARAWVLIRPGPEARTGSLWGAILVALLIAIVGEGFIFNPGLDSLSTSLSLLAVAGLGIPLVALVLSSRSC